MLLPALHSSPKVHIEPLVALVASLGAYVRRVINHDGKRIISNAGHLTIVRDYVRLVARVDVHRDDGTGRGSSNSPRVECGI